MTLARSGDVEQVHEHVRYGWKITDPTGTTISTGENVATLAPDGRFQTVVGFTGPA